MDSRTLTNIGNSILPSASTETYHEKSGIHGTFQTRVIPSLDCHGVFYARAHGEYAGHYVLIATHANGYSCDALAKRMLAAWISGDVVPVTEQAKYILDCGGMTVSLARIEDIARGEF